MPNDLAEAFGCALAEFAAAHRRVVNLVNIAHYEGEGRPEPITDRIRAKGRDILHSARTMGPQFEAARSEFIRELAELSSWPGRPPLEAARGLSAEAQRHEEGTTQFAQLGVTAKALVVHVRAYQDAMAALLTLADGQWPNKGTSMNKALEKPRMQAIERQRLPPGYRHWFTWWRDKIRQAVKEGVDFNAQIVEGQLGLVFTGVMPRKQVGVATHETLFLSDFTESVDWSAALARAVVDDVVKDWPEDHRTAVERQD